MASQRHEVLAHVAQRLSQPPLRPSKRCHCVSPFTTKGTRWKEKKNTRRGAVPPKTANAGKEGEVTSSSMCLWGPGSWEEEGSGQAPDTGTLGLTAGLWALEGRGGLLGKSQWNTLDLRACLRIRLLNKAHPLSSWEHRASLFPRDGCVEGRWPEAGSGSRTGGVSERALTDAHGSGLLPIILYAS